MSGTRVVWQNFHCTVQITSGFEQDMNGATDVIADHGIVDTATVQWQPGELSEDELTSINKARGCDEKDECSG